jgi:hypothetical protein
VEGSSSAEDDSSKEEEEGIAEEGSKTGERGELGELGRAEVPVAVGAVASRETILTTRLLVLTLMLSLMSG